MKYSNFAEPPFRQKTGDVNVLCSWLRRVCRSWKQGQRTSTLLTSSESRWLLCVSHLSTAQSPFFPSNILGMAFLVFLQWIQWMAGWVGVHSKGTMQQDVIYGDVRWGTAHYPSQVRLRARPLDHPLKLHSPASQTVPFTKTVRGGCYRAIYTDKPTPADDPTQINAEHWFHHLTMQSTKRWNFI